MKALIHGNTTRKGNIDRVSISDPDCAIAYCGLEELGADTDIMATWIGLSKEELESYGVCIGGVNQCRHALFKMGIKNYDIPCYPLNLQHFMERKIEITTIAEVTNKILKREYTEPKFVKSIGPKVFTPFNTSEIDLDFLYSVGEQEPVYVSDIVRFMTEWRVYVKNGEIIKLCHYSGNPRVFPNILMIKVMISNFQGPCFYALDVGIIGTTTVLVEINDGYSLGNYGLYPSEYAELLTMRWKELTGK
jgi:hypothetical protein